MTATTIGVIGCGNQGGNHIKSLAGIKDAEIVYVADIDPERCRDSASERFDVSAVAEAYESAYETVVRGSPIC